jgi:hypothetical protein
MARVELILGEISYLVPLRALVSTCDRFAEDPRLLAVPYRVKSPVAPELFGGFLRAVEGKDLELTRENVAALGELCEEFAFRALSGQISAIRDQRSPAEIEAFLELQERVYRQERRLAVLESAFSRLTARVETVLPSLLAASEAMRTDLNGVREWVQRNVEGVETVLPSLVESVRSMRNELTVMGKSSQTTVGRLEKQLQSFRSTFGNSRKELSDLRMAVDNLPIRQLSEDIRSVQATAGASQEELGQLRSKVARMPIAQLCGDIASLQKEVQSIRACWNPEEVDQIQLFARLPNGTHKVITARLNEQILDLKKTIAAKADIPVEFQWLGWQSRHLNDSETIAECLLQPDSTIEVHVKWTPPPEHD